MFTGLIEEVGVLKEICKKGRVVELTISCKKVLEDTKVGASIATNGVCLSVTESGENYFKCDVMNESLNLTSFKFLRPGESINLERAMKLSERLDGHIVQGHVDFLGRILNITKGENYVVKISLPAEFRGYVVKKGSVAIDGISLTVSEVGSDFFEVSIIPITMRDTNLNFKRVGDYLNVETDIVGKYILGARTGGLSFEKLENWGYL